ncbi:hypothetical protein MYAM1_002233 [Malassezia yamatoensis]|uniref:Vacuolar protein sorting-associated protein 8 central domain-containing protein n=1 Tax=Malassezia yamatoensis TaxID=253288 RepID=A0AAJ5YUG6_9BASI|nr:hypothetical protein MYAM1_002233 [Malassezia yamatoensis]
MHAKESGGDTDDSGIEYEEPQNRIEVLVRSELQDSLGNDLARSIDAQSKPSTSAQMMEFDRDLHENLDPDDPLADTRLAVPHSNPIPAKFMRMHRLRTPWSSSSALDQYGMERSTSSNTPSIYTDPNSSMLDESLAFNPSLTPSNIYDSQGSHPTQPIQASQAISNEILHTAHKKSSSVSSNSNLEMSNLPIARPFLHLTLLRKITQQCARSMATDQGDPTSPYALGMPCALQASGSRVAIGFESGTTLVFDLAQNLQAVCRSRAINKWESTTELAGPSHAVTALAMTDDAAYIGVAHASGHILLYDVKDPHMPMRHVMPIHAKDWQKGAWDGHLSNTPITQLAFVGKRKTAIVSADKNGMCFYHSLGKVLGIASNDTLRIYGQYSEQANPPQIIDMAPLPRGTVDHYADQHKFVAILLKEKLLVLGMKPTAQTWFRRSAPSSNFVASHPDHTSSSFSGALAWFPATHENARVHHPTLAFALGTSLRLLVLRSVRVKSDVDQHALSLQESILGSAPDPIVRLQWVHRQLLFVVTTNAWLLYDLHRNAFTEWQPYDPAIAHLTSTSAIDWQHTLRIWHSKFFCLAFGDVYVGDFLPWDARLAQLEQAEDYFEAIQHGLDLYHGQNLGSAIGLPSSPSEQKKVIAERLHKVQVSAAEALFANSEHSDASHKDYAALARASAQIASVVQDSTWLFNDLYTQFELKHLETIFLREIEPFILHGEMHSPTPGVMQKLLDSCARKHDVHRLEQLVLHVDPWHLDLDQTLSLTQKLHLWDANIYVQTCALNDAITPLHSMMPRVEAALQGQDAPDAYLVYTYLNSVAQGVQHPQGTFLDKKQHRTTLQKVLHTLVDSKSYQQEAKSPTPYLQRLLELDAEALLDSMDLAMENDSFNDDEAPSLITRQDFINALWHTFHDLTFTARQFVALFIARNSAKYPQYLKIDSEQIHALFDVLTQNTSSPSPADCELGLESMLSAYAFQFDDKSLDILRTAKYWRVYEYALIKTHRYEQLLALYVTDLDGKHATPSQLYSRVMTMFHLPGAQQDSAALLSIVFEKHDQVPDSLLGDLALVMTRFFPGHCVELLDAMDATPQRQFLFLKPFFELDGRPPRDLDAALKHKWIVLLAQFCPRILVKHLEARPNGYFHWDTVVDAAESYCIYDAMVYAFYQMDQEDKALDKLDSHVRQTIQEMHQLSSLYHREENTTDEQRRRSQAQETLYKLRATVEIVVRLAIQHVSRSSDQVREEWHRLLRALIYYVHAFVDVPTETVQDPVLTQAKDTGEQMLQDALTKLLNSIPYETVSFPGMFRRLVDDPELGSSRSYAAICRVVSGMLSTYRMRCDLLMLGTKLNQADTARLFHQLAEQRSHAAFVPCATRCDVCQAPIQSNPSDSTVIVQLGRVRHRACSELCL